MALTTKVGLNLVATKSPDQNNEVEPDNRISLAIPESSQNISQTSLPVLKEAHLPSPSKPSPKGLARFSSLSPEAIGEENKLDGKKHVVPRAHRTPTPWIFQLDSVILEQQKLRLQNQEEESPLRLKISKLQDILERIDSIQESLEKICELSHNVDHAADLKTISSFNDFLKEQIAAMIFHAEKQESNELEDPPPDKEDLGLELIELTSFLKENQANDLEEVTATAKSFMEHPEVEESKHKESPNEQIELPIILMANTARDLLNFATERHQLIKEKINQLTSQLEN